MFRNKKTLMLAIVASFSLAGCMEPQEITPPPEASEPPRNYEAAVAQFVRTTYFDPYSMRDVQISQPFYQSFPMVGGATWWVCVRANAKNRMGGYTGLRDRPIAFDGDRIDTQKTGMIGPVTASDSGRGICGPAAWRSFPQLARQS